MLTCMLGFCFFVGTPLRSHWKHMSNALAEVEEKTIHAGGLDL